MNAYNGLESICAQAQGGIFDGVAFRILLEGGGGGSTQ